MTDDPLRKAIDEAAIALLSKVSGNATLAELMDGPADAELLIEQVKAFAEVVKWAEVKHKIDPPPPPDKEPSKFDRLKSNFNDSANKRRGGRPRAEAADDSPRPSGDSSAPGSEPSPATH